MFQFVFVINLKDRMISVPTTHQKYHPGDHWALICHCAASMMNRAQHPKESLVLDTVICQSIAKHTVIHHAQSIRTTTEDPVRIPFYSLIQDHFNLFCIHFTHFKTNISFSSPICGDGQCTNLLLCVCAFLSFIFRFNL